MARVRRKGALTPLMTSRKPQKLHPTVLVLVTDQLSCDRLIVAGRRLADTYGCVLEVQNIAYVVVHGSEELYKDVCGQMDQYVDHPHVADVSLRIGSAGYHFWRDEFIRNVTNYMTAEN